MKGPKKNAHLFNRYHAVLFVVAVLVSGFIVINLSDSGTQDGHHLDASLTHNHGAYEYESHETLPEIEIKLLPRTSDEWDIEFITTNFTFADSYNGSNVPGEGHVHVYVNDETVAQLLTPEYRNVQLRKGDVVRATLNTNDHKEYTHDGLAIEDTVTIGD